jgi:hypothetical protein
LNAERLHAIALALQDDIERTNAPGLLGQLSSALERQVQNPADPSAQQEVSTLRQRRESHRVHIATSASG